MYKFEPGTPTIVRDAMMRLQQKLSEPAKPIMTEEEFESLPHIKKCILTCNVIGCKNMVCTHGMLCLEHTKEYRSK